MFEKLKKKFEEDPLTTIVVCSLAVTAAAKLIESVSSARSKHAYANLMNTNTRNRRF